MNNRSRALDLGGGQQNSKTPQNELCYQGREQDAAIKTRDTVQWLFEHLLDVSAKEGGETEGMAAKERSEWQHHYSFGAGKTMGGPSGCNSNDSSL